MDPRILASILALILASTATCHCMYDSLLRAVVQATKQSDSLLRTFVQAKRQATASSEPSFLQAVLQAKQEPSKESKRQPTSLSLGLYNNFDGSEEARQLYDGSLMARRLYDGSSIVRRLGGGCRLA
jgi:type VI protein secretion system component VasK